jgi:hypothetical protein
MAHDVFISYASGDKIVADAVCATLESHGIRCWIAPRDVLPSSSYGEAIIHAINGCRIMILVFSSKANLSAHIPKEVERAVSKGVAILPFRIEDVLPGTALDFFIGSVHWLDALTPPLERHLERLAQNVQTLLSQNGLAIKFKKAESGGAQAGRKPDSRSISAEPRTGPEKFGMATLASDLAGKTRVRFIRSRIFIISCAVGFVAAAIVLSTVPGRIRRMKAPFDLPPFTLSLPTPPQAGSPAINLWATRANDQHRYGEFGYGFTAPYQYENLKGKGIQITQVRLKVDALIHNTPAQFDAWVLIGPEDPNDPGFAAGMPMSPSYWRMPYNLFKPQKEGNKTEDVISKRVPCQVRLVVGDGAFLYHDANKAEFTAIYDVKNRQVVSSSDATQNEEKYPGSCKALDLKQGLYAQALFWDGNTNQSIDITNVELTLTVVRPLQW